MIHRSTIQLILFAKSCQTECVNDANDQLSRSYAFTYDCQNRLKDAIYTDNGNNDIKYSQAVRYNENGAVQIMLCGGNYDGKNSVLDILAYSYTGNQLKKVKDYGVKSTVSCATDFYDGADLEKEYTYDACGSLTSDANKGIAKISYNYWGTPTLIQFTNGSQTEYVYDANGVKLRRIHLTAVDNIVVPINTTVKLSENQILTSDTTDYLGDLIFENGKLDKILFSGGYVSCNDNNSEYFTFHYYVKDHLGNNRAVVSENGTIEQTTSYYPFGNSFADASANPYLQPYKYNGKELDRMHGLDWYDYGARNYDPVILQWNGVDQLCEKYYHVSPYVYCLNNPMNAIDLDGKDVLIWYKDNQGNDCSFRFTGFHGKNAIAVPRNQFVKDFITAYMYNIKNGGGDNLRKAVTNPKYEIDVMDVTLYDKPTYFDSDNHDPKVLWESRRGLQTTNGGKQSAATRLEHEFDHAVHWVDNKYEHVRYRKIKDSEYENKEEKRVIIGSETKTAKANRESTRTDHEGDVYDTIDPISVIPLF